MGKSNSSRRLRTKAATCRTPINSRSPSDAPTRTGTFSSCAEANTAFNRTKSAMLKWPIATPFFSVCFKTFPKRSIKSSFALVLCLLVQFVLIHTLINQTYRPRNSSCPSLFPFQLAASICVDSNTPLQQEIFQSTQVPCVRVSRQAFSSLPEPPSHLREIQGRRDGAIHASAAPRI